MLTTSFMLQGMRTVIVSLQVYIYIAHSNKLNCQWNMLYYKECCLMVRARLLCAAVINTAHYKYILINT